METNGKYGNTCFHDRQECKRQTETPELRAELEPSGRLRPLAKALSAQPSDGRLLRDQREDGSQLAKVALVVDMIVHQCSQRCAHERE